MYLHITAINVYCKGHRKDSGDPFLTVEVNYNANPEEFADVFQHISPNFVEKIEFWELDKTGITRTGHVDTYVDFKLRRVDTSRPDSKPDLSIAEHAQIDGLIAMLKRVMESLGVFIPQEE